MGTRNTLEQQTYAEDIVVKKLTLLDGKDSLYEGNNIVNLSDTTIFYSTKLIEKESHSADDTIDCSTYFSDSDKTEMLSLIAAGKSFALGFHENFSTYYCLSYCIPEVDCYAIFGTGFHGADGSDIDDYAKSLKFSTDNITVALSGKLVLRDKSGTPISVNIKITL